jgi:hypothetical protein
LRAPDFRTTSSAKLEVLFQKNLLNNDVYGKLDQARKARNDFAHRGAAPSQEVALIALTGAFEFASLMRIRLQGRDSVRTSHHTRNFEMSF